MDTPDEAADTGRTVAAGIKRAPKTFVQTLQDHHYGFTADEATQKLHEALEAAFAGVSSQIAAGTSVPMFST